MNLKKILLLSVMAIAMAVSAGASGSDLSVEARSLRAKIVSYLSETQHSPSIDEDGDIRFTYEGNTYFIQLFDIGDKVALRYLVGVTVPEGVSQQKAKSICISIVQSKLCSRALLSSSGRSIHVQLDGFCSGIQMFKSLFKANMILLDTVSDNVITQLNE